MQKRIYKLTIMLVLLSASIYAQNINVNFGQIQNVEKRTNITLLGGDKDNIYFLKTKYSGGLFTNSGSEFYLQVNDADMKVKKITQLAMPEIKKEKFTYEDINIYNNDLKLFTSYYDKKADKNFSYVNSINEKGLVDKDYLELDVIDAEKARNKGTFTFRYSNDSSKVLLVRQNPYKKGQKESFVCKVFDRKFNTLFERKIELPFKDDKFSFFGYTVSNSGRVYVLGSFELKNKSRKKPGAIYTIISVDNETQGFQQYDLDIDKFLREMFIKVNTQDDLICAGFYADEKNKGTKGTIALKISGSTKEITNKSVEKFDNKLLESIVGTSKRKQAKGLYEFDIRDLILKNDGGILMIAEQFWIRVVTSRSSNGVTTRTYHYYNNDILVINLNSDMTTQWINNIPKNQHTVNDGARYNSYGYHINNGKLYIFYNDHKKNSSIANYKKWKVMTKPSNSNFTMVTISGNGEMVMDIIFDNKKEKVVTMPGRHSRLDDNNLVLFTRSVSKNPFSPFKYKLAKISFN